jgi:hypothetical protein
MNLNKPEELEDLDKNILGQTDTNIQSEANAPLPWSEEE